MSKKKLIIILIIAGLLIIGGVVLEKFIVKNRDEQKHKDFLSSYQNERTNQIKEVNPELYDRLIKQIEEANKKLAENSNDYNALISLGIAQNALGDLKSAIVSYKKASEVSPVGSIHWNNLADIYIRLEEYDKAEEAFINYIKNIPGDPDAYLGLARLYMTGKIGDTQKAKETIQQGMGIVADKTGLEQALKRVEEGQYP